VGNNLPAGLGASEARVLRVGYVADLDPVFAKCRVALSPVRFGTGIKTKNLSALAHGVPLVTTTIGADGMELQHNETALIADMPQEFADAASRIYSDETLWCELARRGREHILEYFSEQRMQEAVRIVIEHARHTKPKTHEPDFEWPYLIVEKRFPEVVSGEPAGQRLLLRMARYVSLAEEFLVQGEPARALEQLRYIFSHLRGRVPASGLYLRAVQLMSRGYGELGENEKAAEYARRIQGGSLEWTFGRAAGCGTEKWAQGARGQACGRAAIFRNHPDLQPSGGTEGVSGRAGATNHAAGNVRGDRGGRWFHG